MIDRWPVCSQSGEPTFLLRLAALDLGEDRAGRRGYTLMCAHANPARAGVVILQTLTFLGLYLEKRHTVDLHDGNRTARGERSWPAGMSKLNCWQFDLIATASCGWSGDGDVWEWWVRLKTIGPGANGTADVSLSFNKFLTRTQRTDASKLARMASRDVITT